MAEDDREINQMICDYLGSLGFHTHGVYNGGEALDYLHQEADVDLLLLDVMMPRLDGIEVLRKLRRLAPALPILMVTAKVEEVDSVLAFELGADDYIRKPFGMKELAARVRAVLRRRKIFQEESHEVLRLGALELDRERFRATLEGKDISLTVGQFDILARMMASPGKVFDRMELLKAFQENPYEGYERTIDVHIKNIRKIIEKDPSSPEYILTVWGVGYKMEAPR